MHVRPPSCRRPSRRARPGPRSSLAPALALLSLVMGLAGGAAPALAQEPAPDAAVRAREAARAAEEAARAAREAARAVRAGEAPAPTPEASPPAPAPAPLPEDEAAEAAARAAVAAEEAARAAQDAAEAAREAAARRAASPPAPAADEAAGSAADEARAAAREAREAARAARLAAREAEQAREQRFARTGLYVGAAALWAPEFFDDGEVVARSSRGLSAQLGWRLHPHVALELRGDWLEGFDLSYPEVAGAFSEGGAEGDLEAWSVTGNLKLYPLTGRFQPYLVAGFGALHADFDVEDRLTGAAFRSSDTDALARAGVGLEVFLSEFVLLGAEAAFNGAGGDVENLDFGTVQAGLQFRF